MRGALEGIRSLTQPDLDLQRSSQRAFCGEALEMKKAARLNNGPAFN